MADNILANNPYLDDYDPSKDYTHIVAVPGRVAQAREFTQAQTIQKDLLGRLGNAIFKPGAIVSGASINIDGTRVTVSEGLIFLDGLVRRFKGGSVVITGTGSEVVGVKIKSSIVTAEQDETLKDPAVSFANYGLEGADRLKEEVVLTVNDATATTIYNLENGNVVVQKVNSDDNKLTETLARRTFDESGNYKIYGLELRDRKESSSTDIRLMLTQGKAYIKGYEVVKPYITYVDFERSTSVRAILNEPKVYSTTQSEYFINNHPVQSILKLQGQVRVTDEVVTRSNVAGGLDYLGNSAIVRIVSVSNNVKTYREGTDYQLTSDGIDWSLNGIEPEVGTTYKVTYDYNKTMKLGTDYKLNVTDTTSSIVFLSGAKPNANTPILIDYNFYLARKDLVLLDRLGNISTIKGLPEIERLCDSPINRDNDFLVIGSVLIKPNSDKVEVLNYYTTRLTQADIYSLQRRLEDMEYNQAMSDLDKEAKEGEQATNLKGILTDGFIGLTKADTTHSDFNCTIDTDNGELCLPSTEKVGKLNINTSTSDTKIGKINNYVMAPFTEVMGKEQPYTTNTMLVNPYSAYNPMCLVKVNPSVDNWIDNEKVVLQDTKVQSTTLRRWWFHRGSSWAEEERANWERLGFTSFNTKGNEFSASKVSSSIASVIDKALMYMRTKEIQVEGYNFSAGEDIRCLFNHVQIPFTPLTGFTQGTAPNTVRSDSKGVVKGKITIPPNTPCGTVKVDLKSPTGEGYTTYQAEGRLRVTTEQVTTTIAKVVREARPVDPLAQSFSFKEDRILTSVGLFFSAKDANRSVIVQIRSMTNGFPGTEIYDEVILAPSDIKISANGSAETKVTLNKPFYCKAEQQYCFCIQSDSNVPAMHIATVGEKIIDSTSYVTQQPNPEGVLFSSSNALTWTVHQSSDLKFKLYNARYTERGNIVFEGVEFDSIQRLLLAVDYDDNTNLGINWTYSLDGTSYYPLETFSLMELTKLGNRVLIRAVINYSEYMSPVLSQEVMNLVGYKNGNAGTYLTRTMFLSENYTKLRVSFDAIIPSGTKVEAYYQDSSTGPFKKLESPTTTVISNTKSNYTYNLTGLNSKYYKCMIKLETNNPLVAPRVSKLLNILKY